MSGPEFITDVTQVALDVPIESLQADMSMPPELINEQLSVRELSAEELERRKRDTELVGILQGKDSDENAKARAFDEICKTYYSTTLACIRRSYEPTDSYAAEDLTQETFLRVYKSIDTFTLGTNLPGWIHRIGSNVAIDAKRRQKRLPPESFVDGWVENNGGRDPRDNTSFSFENELVTRLDLGPYIQKRLAQLPFDFAAAVLLIDGYGMSILEAADWLGVKKRGTILSRSHRGRVLLRAMPKPVGYSFKDDEQTNTEKALQTTD
jgi:DNA-directed RNA polymerase specialized sigma24 family protein